MKFWFQFLVKRSSFFQHHQYFSDSRAFQYLMNCHWTRHWGNESTFSTKKMLLKEGKHPFFLFIFPVNMKWVLTHKHDVRFPLDIIITISCLIPNPWLYLRALRNTIYIILYSVELKVTSAGKIWFHHLYAFLTIKNAETVKANHATYTNSTKVLSNVSDFWWRRSMNSFQIRCSRLPSNIFHLSKMQVCAIMVL
jgi:hypothetical protein